MKKSEISIGIITLLVMAAIVTIMVIYFGVKAFSTTQDDLAKIDLMEIQQQLKAAAADVKPDFGSQKTVTLKIPAGITELCFITDEHRNRLPFIFRESNPFIMNAMEVQDNVFIKGKSADDFIPMRIEALVTAQGFECFRPVGGKITVTFEGTGTLTKVISPVENLAVKGKADPNRLDKDLILVSPKYLAELTLPEGTKIVFPPGTSDSYITMTEMQGSANPSSIKQFSSIYELSPLGSLVQSEPAKKATISISYDPYEMTKAEFLKVYYYDSASSSWKAILCDNQPITADIIGCDAVRIDEAKSVVTADIDTFTKYVIGYEI